MVLQSLGIDTEVLDIAAPGMDEARDFMRGGAKKKENQRNVLPPQIFNGDTYCGVRIRDIFLFTTLIFDHGHVTDSPRYVLIILVRSIEEIPNSRVLL